MKKVLAGLLVAATFASPASAKDAFDGVQCGADVAKALAGRKIPNGPAAELEKRHAALGLKLEDSDMLDEPLNYEAWTICGDTYHVILKKDVVTDAVKADHSKAAPLFLGPCEENGKLMDDTVLAILKPGDPAAAKWPATTAWRLDAKSGKFAPVSAAGLMCSRDGISTSDGGR